MLNFQVLVSIAINKNNQRLKNLEVFPFFFSYFQDI